MAARPFTRHCSTQAWRSARAPCNASSPGFHSEPAPQARASQHPAFINRKPRPCRLSPHRHSACKARPTRHGPARTSPRPSSKAASPTHSCAKGADMKIAVLNFSGNVGKTTIARHLLLPRIPGAALIAVESINAEDDHQGQSLRGRQFAELQEYLQTVDSAVVDIGASNVEELLGLMHRYRGSQEDFDAFVIPTVPALKQQRDTTATLLEMSRLGVPASRLKIVFNMVEEDSDITQTFEPLLEFLLACPVATASIRARLSANEIYGRVKSMEVAPNLIQL
eukprot:Opistho-1_new@71751